MNEPFVRKLLDRLVGGLEGAVQATDGRPQAVRFSALVRGALDGLVRAARDKDGESATIAEAFPLIAPVLPGLRAAIVEHLCPAH